MAYKSVQQKTNALAAIADAYSDLTDLGSECREAADNMEGANLGHLEKCETFSSTADTLEGISEVDVDTKHTEAFEAVEVTYSEMVNKDKRRGPSRDVRLSNAVSMLRAAAEALEAKVLELETLALTDEVVAERREAMSTAADEATEMADEVDGNCEFPGMFG